MSVQIRTFRIELYNWDDGGYLGDIEKRIGGRLPSKIEIENEIKEQGFSKATSFKVFEQKFELVEELDDGSRGDEKQASFDIEPEAM